MTRIPTEGDPIEIGPARLPAIIDLRHAVLRAGLPRDEAVFAGDHSDDARHYAATIDGRVVGCVTLHPSRWADEPAWQLRGMATDPALRGRGIGRALLEYLQADVRTTTTQLLWCNARVPAAGFYEAMGWTIRSEAFDIPTAGPHYRMTKRL